MVDIWQNLLKNAVTFMGAQREALVVIRVGRQGKDVEPFELAGVGSMVELRGSTSHADSEGSGLGATISIALRGALSLPAAAAGR